MKELEWHIKHGRDKSEASFKVATDKTMELFETTNDRFGQGLKVSVVDV